jgi:hypothetical protein
MLRKVCAVLILSLLVVVAAACDTGELKTSASPATTAEAEEATVGTPERLQIQPGAAAGTLSPEQLATLEAALEGTYLPGPQLPEEGTPVPPSGGPTLPPTRAAGS